MRILKKILMLVMMAGALAAWQYASAQDTATGATGATADAAVEATKDDPQTQTPATPGDAAKSAGTVKQGYVKVGKQMEWVGSNDIVELAPTPMLDEEGKQRLDPDAKLMFNPPVKQQRDKHGHPLFDEKGKPVFQTDKELGYDETGKKVHEEKVKPPKMTPVAIVAGTYTVDGIIGKAELNYDIADLKYIYLYCPGIGITVISNAPFPGAKEQPAAFSGKTLTVSVGEHTMQLSSDKSLLQDKKPESAFVVVDRDFMLPSKFPVVGYGTIRKPPYMWPGAKAQAVRTGSIIPPPPPANLMPVLLLKGCPQGQMRKPGPPVLPGQIAPEQPCVPIPKSAVMRVVSTPASATPAVAAKPAPKPVVAPAPVEEADKAPEPPPSTALEAVPATPETTPTPATATPQM